MTNHPSPPAGDRNHHVCVPSPRLAGCSDIGSKHRSNQDAFSVATKGDGTFVAAVADGVSTAAGAERASLAAADAACLRLAAETDLGASPDHALAVAFDDAQSAVLQAHEGEAPSACTLIACVSMPQEIVVGNVGDSRAYWIGDRGEALLLSTDDSMAQARMQLGMSREEAEQSIQAHAITRWLGRDAQDVAPTTRSHRPDGPGWLLLCTDGLWNYASSEPEMAALFRQLDASERPAAELAQDLVAWANQQGGRDNITVVVARHDG